MVLRRVQLEQICYKANWYVTQHVTRWNVNNTRMMLSGTSKFRKAEWILWFDGIVNWFKSTINKTSRYMKHKQTMGRLCVVWNGTRWGAVSTHRTLIVTLAIKTKNEMAIQMQIKVWNTRGSEYVTSFIWLYFNVKTLLTLSRHSNGNRCLLS